jgi:hypothetical protein
MEYCGIRDSALHLFHDAIDSAEARTSHLATAYSLGANYAA